MDALMDVPNGMSSNEIHLIGWVLRGIGNMKPFARLGWAWRYNAKSSIQPEYTQLGWCLPFAQPDSGCWPRKLSWAPGEPRGYFEC